MNIRSLTLIIAIFLTACGTNAPSATPTAETIATEPVATHAPAATNTPQSAEPTLKPTLQPTRVPPTATEVPATIAPATATGIPPTAIPVTATIIPPTAVPTQAASGQFGEEILFLRAGNLWAHDPGSQQERQIAAGVADFAIDPRAEQIALVRGVGIQSEIWVVARSGSGLRQITHNQRAEASMAWSPDGAALIYASAASNEPLVRDWLAMPRWCVVSEIRVVDLASSAEKTLATGCEPALSPDGKRIAYTAPPTAAMPGAPAGDIRVANSVRLINRLGQNGWNFAKAQGQDPFGDGMLVYGPSWAPDGSKVLYHRYTGAQVEVDINLSEIGGSFEGKGRVLGEGAGMLLPARFDPTGKVVAITSYDAGNARGLTGYGAWNVQLIALAGSREIALPSGTLTVIGQEAGQLNGGQAIAWAPTGMALAVQLPTAWQPNADPETWGTGSGEIWRWTGGATAAEVLVHDVDYASTIAWLPGSR